TWKPEAAWRFPGPAAFDIALSPDGAVLAAAFNEFRNDRTGGHESPVVAGVKLLQRASLGVVPLFEAQPHVVNGLAFSPDGKNLACGYRDQMTQVWDVSARKAVQSYKTKTESQLYCLS